MTLACDNAVNTRQSSCCRQSKRQSKTNDEKVLSDNNALLVITSTRWVSARGAYYIGSRTSKKTGVRQKRPEIKADKGKTKSEFVMKRTDR